MNEELALETIQQLFEDFKIFSEDFNTSRLGFLLMVFILSLKPERWDEPEISYEKFCQALNIVKNNKGIQKMLKVKNEFEME